MLELAILGPSDRNPPCMATELRKRLTGFTPRRISGHSSYGSLYPALRRMAGRGADRRECRPRPEPR